MRNSDKLNRAFAAHQYKAQSSVKRDNLHTNGNRPSRRSPLCLYGFSYGCSLYSLAWKLPSAMPLASMPKAAWAFFTAFSVMAP